MNKTPNNNQRGSERGGRDDRSRGQGSRPYRGGERSSYGGDRGNRVDRGDQGNRDSRNRGRDDRPRRFEKPKGGEEFHHRGEPGVEISGRTMEDVTAEACRRFGVNRDQMKIQIVSQGSKGFLGILGTKPAKARIQLTSGAIPNYAETALNKILKEMGLPDKVRRKNDVDGNLVLDIQGPSGGVLIGRHGQTLESLQYVLQKILQRVTGEEKSLVIVDVESYRERQNDKLRELAVSVARKAKDTGEEVGLRPMTARDRRIVHMTLKDDHEVTTQSQGEGIRRRVVVIPKNKKVPAPKPEEGAPVAVSEAMPTAEAVPVEASLEEPGNVVPSPPVVEDDIGNH